MQIFECFKRVERKRRHNSYSEFDKSLVNVNERLIKEFNTSYTTIQ